MMKQPKAPQNRYAGVSLSATEANKKGPLTTRGKAALFSLALIGVIGFASFWNPPTGSVHEFTTASDYDAGRDAGCTNSGEGCHGTEYEYTDFNAYHPDSDCATCHEYTGAGCIPCHTPTAHECAACHDGTMEGASDCVRLADPYPNGHYRETTHTAMGTDMDQVVRAAENGAAQATCENCHSRDLAAAHTGVPVVADSTYGETVGCGECHNDLRSRGMAEVLSNWENRACDDCHTLDSSSPMHSASVANSIETSGTAGCASTGSGCHDLDDLHGLHPDAPESCSGSAAEGEAGCHDFEVEAHAPAARTCGGGDYQACHQPYVNHTYSHAEDREQHSPTSSFPARQVFNGVACGDCHHMSGDGVSLVTEHALGTSARTNVPGNNCRNCHNDPASLEAIENDWSVRDTGYACETCHDGGGLDTAHGRPLEDVHTFEGSEGCASSGAGCHPTANVALVGDGPDALHDDCLTCHDRTASGTNRSYDPNTSTCGAGRECHALPGAYVPGGVSHASVNGRDATHAARERQGRATLSDPASGRDEACSTCHDMLLGGEHTRDHVAIAENSCDGCHNASDAVSAIVKADWTSSAAGDRTCATCHDVNAAHGGRDDVHGATELHRLSGDAAPGSCAKPGCHSTVDLRVLHGEVGCGIDGCHSASGDIRGAGIKSCGGPEGADGCHAGKDRHTSADDKHFAVERHHKTGEPTPNSCEKGGCHSTTDVRKLHDTKHCYTSGCHVEGGPTLMTCGGPDGTPACHTSSTRHTEADDKHFAVELDRITGDPKPGSCAKDGCHSTTDVRKLHDTKHCYTSGCHVEGGPTLMTCGGPAGTLSCHAGDEKHANKTDKHQAIERHHSTGEAIPGSCAKPGCHATVDVRTLHKTTRCYNTEGCHMAGGPTLMTCGGPDGTVACHTSSTRHTEADDKHFATELHRITGDASPGSCAKDGCHATTDVRALHKTLHCYTAGCHVEGGPTLMSCGGPDGATGCHNESERHANMDDKHIGVEIDSSGVPTPGTCAHSGCHATVALKTLHAATSCYGTNGCHTAGGPVAQSCGGPDGSGNCHTSSNRHNVDHSADMTGTVGGIVYGPGENEGCIVAGCHVSSLVGEHRNAMTAGRLEGGGVYVCAVCHEHDGDAGNGAYSSLAAVKSAIAAGDKRCVACHYGGASDGPTAVASPPVPPCVTGPLPAATLMSTVDGANTVEAAVVATAPADAPEAPDASEASTDSAPADSSDEPATEPAPADDEAAPADEPAADEGDTGSGDPCTYEGAETTASARLVRSSAVIEVCLTCHETR